MVTFLAGGTGTPKLLAGLDPDERAAATVIGNTGDDIELGGLLVCPDLDTVMFLAGGVLDRETWWGIDGDSTATHDRLCELAEAAGLDCGPRPLPDDRQVGGRDIARWRRFSGVGEFMEIGDLDRAVHVTRTSLLDEGHTLTEVTGRLGRAFDVDLELLPMSDDPVSSIVHTPGGEQHFQAFWVGHGGEPAVESVEFRGAHGARPTPAVLEALEAPVVLGPSNPVTSIGPMLALDGVRSALEATRVVAVSPFVGDRAFSGPAPKLMAATGHKASTAGVADVYGFADAFVLDDDDPTELNRPVVRTDTQIDTDTDAARVYAACTAALDGAA